MSKVTSGPRGPRGSLQRQYALVAMLFALLVAGIVFLFGHLISQSLSRSYLQDALITGREATERFAEELATDEFEEFKVVERRSELIGRTLQGLPQRELLESIQVTDRDGKVVFSMDLRTTEDLPEDAAAAMELGGAIADQGLRETEDSYEISVPLGEVGTVVGRVSKHRLAERVTELRRELLIQTTSVAALTLLTLGVAFVFVWYLIQRTRRAEAKRREAEELAALGTLAANLAHEIRNPLNSINLNLELLDEDLQAAVPEARDSLQSTRSEVGRLARLVSDFLDYARPSRPSFDQVNLRKLAVEVLEFLRPEARSMGVHLRQVHKTGEVLVRGDQAQLRQVLLNLILNAIQAVAPLAAERRVVELDEEVGDSKVVLVVRDRGDGIPEEEIPEARRAFHTSRRGGSGLGLAIADRIAAAHQGRIELHNREGGGFEARVVLPRSGDDGKISA